MKYRITDNAPADLGKAGDTINIRKKDAEHLERKGYIEEIEDDEKTPAPPAPPAGEQGKVPAVEAPKEPKSDGKRP